CTATSAMLCRPEDGRQNASSGETSASAALRSGPCHAAGPYPSSRTRVSNCASGVAETAALLVLIKILLGEVLRDEIHSTNPSRAELAFEFPRLPVVPESFADPVE